MDWYNSTGNRADFKTITSSGVSGGGGGAADWKLLSQINPAAHANQTGKPLYCVSKCTGKLYDIIGIYFHMDSS